MLTAEYDREMDIAVNRREARKEGHKEAIELFEQGLSIEEIKERLNQEELLSRS